jgi:tetratricopeptide (TPR) repeat protein
MKKKQIKKSKAEENNSKKLRDKVLSEKFHRWLMIYLGIFISFFAFLLYSGSIEHDFALDDGTVVHENSVTTQGFSGIPTILKTDYWYGSGHNTSRVPIYRPTSLIVYAIVWECSPGNPHAYHFINVLFYAISCLLLFLVLCKLFEDQNLLFPFICALLYTAHPIHTEVVNNIKSLDEILCFLFGLGSIWFFLKNALSGSKLFLLAGAISFFLALLSKENGISFLLIIPLTLFFFTSTSLRKIFTVFLTPLVLTGAWLLLRNIVFEDLPLNTGNTGSILNNTLNAATDTGSRYATAFYILLKYIGLLIFPHPLSYDYSFSQINIQNSSSPLALFGILFYTGIAIYALLNLKKKSIVAYGILFFLITLAPVSNLFFLLAATMAERFMYIPSLGFCIVLTYFLIRLSKTEYLKNSFQNLFAFFAAHKTVFLVVLLMVALYYYKTKQRSLDWKDSLTLFSRDAETSGNSARTNQSLGSALMLSAMKIPNIQSRSDTFTMSKNYLKKALSIYPEFYVPYSHLGVIYLFENKLDSAYDCLNKAVRIMPDDVDVNFNLGLTLFHLQKNQEAITFLNKTIRLAPNHEQAYYNLAALYQNTQDYDKALAHYSKVIELNPNNANAYYNSGTIMRLKGDNVKANEYFEKARSLGFKTK